MVPTILRQLWPAEDGKVYPVEHPPNPVLVNLVFPSKIGTATLISLYAGQQASRSKIEPFPPPQLIITVCL